MAACEGFTIGQFCEKCFQNSHMLGMAEGVKWARAAIVSSRPHERQRCLVNA